MKAQVILLQKLLTNNVSKQIKTEPKQLKESLAQLPSLSNDIVTKTNLLVLSNRKEKQIARQLQQLQNHLVQLLNTLWQYECENKLDGEFNEAYACLSGILEQIRQNHQPYFNESMAVPVYLLQSSLAQLKQKQVQVISNFKKKKINDALQQLIVRAFDRFIAANSANYRQLLYMQKLQKSLIELQTDNTDANGVLITHLLYYGFNCITFNQYYQLKISEELLQSYHLDEQFERLCYYEKQFKIQQEKANLYYKPTNPSSKTVLLTFVQAEIACLIRKQEFTKPKLTELKPYANFRAYQLKTTLSVDGLAYLLRLFIEAEVIDANPRAELMAFMAKHVQTRGISTGVISASSLKTKYKQVTQHTATGVKRLLHKMLSKIEDNFGVHSTVFILML